MTGTLTDRVGFEHPNRRNPSPRQTATLELIAGVALVVSTVVAATVVSIGIARADVIGSAPAPGDLLGVAVLIGLILAGWGGIIALMAHTAPRRD